MNRARPHRSALVLLLFGVAVAAPGCDLGPGVCGLWNNNPDACPAGAQTQTCPVLMNVTGTVTVWATLSTAYDTGPLFTVGECMKVTQATCKPCDDGAGGLLQSVGQLCAGDDANPAPPGGPSCCHGLTCEDAAASDMGTCQGTLQPCPQPPPPNWQPLPTTILRQMARAMENTLNGKGGLPASVIPEFVGNQTMFPKSVFYEVKAVTGALTPGTSNYQILGFLDVANTLNAMDAGPHPAPAVFFITTGNTTVSTGVLTQAQATGWSVAVWQQKVLYDANMYDANSATNNPNLSLGPVVCLTPNLCTSPAPFPVPTAPVPWPVSPLTSPTTPPSALIVPGDPDPAEVD